MEKNIKLCHYHINGEYTKIHIRELIYCVCWPNIRELLIFSTKVSEFEYFATRF